MLIEERLDVGLGPAVNTKGSVVGANHRALGPEYRVLQKDAWPWVVRPMERRVGMAFAFHSDLLISLILSRGKPMLNTLVMRMALSDLCSLRCRFSRMFGLGLSLSGLSPIMNTARG